MSLEERFFEFIGEQLETSLKRMESSMHRNFKRIGEQLTAQSTALSRLQADNDAIKATLTDLQTNAQTQADAILAANARLQKSIDDLKNAAGDEDAINAVAADLEATQATLKTVSDGLAASATGEGGIDQPAVAVILPNAAAIAPGGSQQFTSQTPGAWSATSGDVDQTGLYTGPADQTITDDDVTLTPTDTTLAAVTAHVIIG